MVETQSGENGSLVLPVCMVSNGRSLKCKSGGRKGSSGAVAYQRAKVTSVQGKQAGRQVSGASPVH
eukprot:1742937-Amphidinium_carterae.1